MSQTAFLFDDRVLEAPAPSDLPVLHERAADEVSSSREEYQIPRDILEILGPIGTCLSDCFHRMTLAEQAIKRFCARHPRHAKRLNRAFGILNWYLPERVLDAIYVAHLDELLQRVVDGHSVSEGTRAEVLAFLSLASLRAPMGHQAAAAYAALFRELLGAEAQFEDDTYPVEPWRGAAAEVVADLRRKLSVADRIYSEKGDGE